jgi:hypothetical protein
MLYHEVGSSGVKLSAIGFGAMRWPSEQVAFEAINRGLDVGINYLDTSSGYCGGNSQKWSGRAVKARRNELYFSNKCHWAKAPAADEVRKAIDASLAATGLDYFDFYQIWGLQDTAVVNEATKKGGFIEGVRKAQKDGLIRVGLGFTFHGPVETFKAAVDTGEFLCATVSYNLMRRKDEVLIDYAASKGVGIIIMNPLAGGVLGLARTGAFDFLKGGGTGPCYGALRFLLANPGITTAIVGFRAVEEVDQAVQALDGAEKLDEDYRRRLIEKMDAVKLLEGDFCTGCGYCKECPNGFDPSRIMKAMRDFVVYGVPKNKLTDWIWSQYAHENIAQKIQLCTECGQCQEKCPQHLKIAEEIKKVKAALTGG